MTAKTITSEMQRAIDYAQANGQVIYAGRNVDRNGKSTRFAASTLSALVDRDIAERYIHPDGGFAVSVFRISGGC